MALRSVAESLSDWADTQSGRGVTWHRPSGNYRIRLRRDELLYFYEAQYWVFAIFKRLNASEADYLRHTLSEPDSLLETQKYWRCRLHSRPDADAVIRVLERRVYSGTW